MVASVPEETKRSFSIDGTAAWMSAGEIGFGGVDAPKLAE